MKTVPTATDTNMDISTGITMDTRMPSLAMDMIIVGPTVMTITRKASTTGAMLATTQGIVRGVGAIIIATTAVITRAPQASRVPHDACPVDHRGVCRERETNFALVPSCCLSCLNYPSSLTTNRCRRPSE
jgi:hypothetical protein